MSGTFGADLVLDIWMVQGTGYGGGSKQSLATQHKQTVDLPHHAL